MAASQKSNMAPKAPNAIKRSEIAIMVLTSILSHVNTENVVRGIGEKGSNVEKLCTRDAQGLLSASFDHIFFI